MRKIRMILLCVLLIFSLSGCGQKGQEATQTKTSDEKIAETSEIRETLAETENSETDEDTEMKLYFSDIEIPISWENCKAVRELEEEVANGDIIVSMSMYGGWEQVGSLGRSYSRTDHQMTAQSGDVVCTTEIRSLYSMVRTPGHIQSLDVWNCHRTSLKSCFQMEISP